MSVKMAHDERSDSALSPMHNQGNEAEGFEIELPDGLRSPQLKNTALIIQKALPLVSSTENEPHENSLRLIIFLMLNTMIGSGILNQPEVFQKSGICGALMSFAVCTVFIWLGLVLLIESGEAIKTLDYSELAKAAFGRTGEIIVDALIIMNNFGALLSYIVIVGGTLAELLDSWGCYTEACNVYYMTCFTVFTIVLPVCMLRFYGHLTYISIFSISSIASVLVLVLIGGPIVGDGSRGRAFNGSGAVENF
jgi:amino acid permease